MKPDHHNATFCQSGHQVLNYLLSTQEVQLTNNSKPEKTPAAAVLRIREGWGNAILERRLEKTIQGAYKDSVSSNFY